TNRSWFIERAISSFLMLAILLYKRSNLYFIIHLFSFQRTCLTSFCLTSQELDHIMLVAFLSNLFLIISSATSLQEMSFSKQRLIIYHA
ncbi:hypothetical protein ABEW32_00005, partial [Paenibacillus jamilae]|uniref:hypothetical protein n=1 Tax=Paenibacillus jamilae TaxID=114136 RepID=UPI003D26A644